MNKIIELYTLGRSSFEIARILGLDSIYVSKVLLNYEMARTAKEWESNAN